MFSWKIVYLKIFFSGKYTIKYYLSYNQSFEAGLSAKNKNIRKKKGTRMTETKIKEFKRYFDNDPTVRKRTFKIPRDYIHNLVKTKQKLHTVKLYQKDLYQKESTRIVARPKCGLFYRNFLNYKILGVAYH